MIVVVIVGLGLTKDFQTGAWIVTLPTIVGVFLFTFLVRGFLIDRMQLVRWVMNVSLLVALLLIFGVGVGSGANASAGERALSLGLLALYMGSFFWMFSDPQVARHG
ncbi:MAG: hypothetical protein ACPGYV_11600 [Phycisphaeraceae bacterium]